MALVASFGASLRIGAESLTFEALGSFNIVFSFTGLGASLTANAENLAIWADEAGLAL